MIDTELRATRLTTLGEEGNHVSREEEERVGEGAAASAPTPNLWRIKGINSFLLNWIFLRSRIPGGEGHGFGEPEGP